MVLTSESNAQIGLLKKILADKKFRTEYGLYCVEGEKLVRDALRFGKTVEKIFVKESLFNKLDFPSEAEKIVVSDDVFCKISQLKTTQGVAAFLKIPEKTEFSVADNCLVLENLQDNGNIGALLRTAAATGFSNVFLVNCADVYAPKTVRAAMSAHFVLNLFVAGKIENVFSTLKDFTIVCADMGGQSVFEFEKPKKLAVVLGNEGNGVSDFVKSNAAATVSLPMKNNLESLNVSVAGSVIMYLLSK